ncbi:DUF982 domain-containing protein [Aminobacter anthyllidis]|uniref:DUF982 domain-containing protein n=1 Tax=Aminobacter anthyllidis TaxID=1035067 RepID=UPI0024569F1C|nr:DUF982 domain-containing protein [Aminobacter anthyllidis]MDH4985211.1 DUF982 domain-containing protein [Aminobacter anthyllidis]
MVASKPFARPVLVELGRPGNYRRIMSVGDAAACLATSWPLNRGPRHRHAVQTCLRVLEGHHSSEDARRAFVAAAMESEVLVANDIAASSSEGK